MKEEKLIEHGYVRLMPEIEEARIYRKSFGEISVELNGNCGISGEDWNCHIDDDHGMTLGSLIVKDYTEVQAFCIFIKNLLKIRQLKAKRK